MANFYLNFSFLLATNRETIKNVITVTIPEVDPNGGGHYVTVSKVLTLNKPTEGFII